MRRLVLGVLVLVVLTALALAGRGYRTDRVDEVSSAPVGTLIGQGTALQTDLHDVLSRGFEDRHRDVVTGYEPVGSERGAGLFSSGVASFAGVDAALDVGDELDGATRRCAGDLLQLPAYAEPVAVVVNLPGVSRLRLSPEAVRGLLDEMITSWNDPAIREDNPGLELPPARVTPVLDDDEAATTRALRSWLGENGEAADPDRAVVVDGPDEVASAVHRTPYSIGYLTLTAADGLRPVSVGSGQRYAAPGVRGVQRLLAGSDVEEGRASGDLALDTSTANRSRGYPVAVVTYVLACSSYASPDEARLVKAYLTWMYSLEAQELVARTLDGAGVPDSIRRRSAGLVGEIGLPTD